MPKACLRHDGRGIGRRLRLGRFTNPCIQPIRSSCSRRPPGAGYGLLVWLCLGGLFGLVPTERWLGVAGFGLAFALITAGLLSSTAHLGRPERAWRAFSQWRTSWLSREGVMAVATYVPAGVLAIGWVFLESIDGMFAVAAVLTVLVRARHALHDRHDLRLAAHDPAVASAAHGADLHRAGTCERRRAVQSAAARARCGRRLGRLAGRCVAGSSPPQ